MAFCLSPSSTALSRTQLLFGLNFSISLPRRSLTLAFSRRKNHASALTSSSNKKKGLKYKEVKEEEIEGDAFEALFSMLEEDLKNDVVFSDDDNDFEEEDIEQLQRELEEVLGVDDDDDDVILVEDNDNDDGEEEEEEEERQVKLKNWQIRRLAVALKNGRRKTSIKNLSAELCLDRALVLELLRDPPPNLVMMSAALPDEPEPKPVALRVIEPEKPIESVPVEPVIAESVKSGGAGKAPVHVMRQQWSAQKRLKKAHVDTLERVYRRTKRPTNTMISSIVQVTNLPRKRVVKWFEEKRAEEGVPDHRVPYLRSVAETAS